MATACLRASIVGRIAWKRSTGLAGSLEIYGYITFHHRPNRQSIFFYTGPHHFIDLNYFHPTDMLFICSRLFQKKMASGFLK